MAHAPHTYIASYLILVKNEEVLLVRRYQTGFEDGKYSLPAGHVEVGETYLEALIRESKEEIGVTLTEKQVTVSHVMHRKALDREYVDVFYIAKEWGGKIENKEPEKCDDLSWFPIEKLPENIIPYVKTALQNSFDGIPFSEYGWGR